MRLIQALHPHIKIGWMKRPKTRFLSEKRWVCRNIFILWNAYFARVMRDEVSILFLPTLVIKTTLFELGLVSLTKNLWRLPTAITSVILFWIPVLFFFSVLFFHWGAGISSSPWRLFKVFATNSCLLCYIGAVECLLGYSGNSMWRFDFFMLHLSLVYLDIPLHRMWLHCKGWQGLREANTLCPIFLLPSTVEVVQWPKQMLTFSCNQQNIEIIFSLHRHEEFIVDLIICLIPSWWRNIGQIGNGLFLLFFS